MADLSDVMNTLVSTISGILYPNGTGQPSIVSGVSISVFPGWPIPATLTAAIAAGNCQVSVYPRPEERNTTRYPLSMQTLSVNTPTLTLTISGQTVTVAGTIPPSNNPHNAMVLANGGPYVYAVLPTDTLNGIAAALAALIAAGIAGTSSSGPVITLPSSARLQAARIGVTGTSAMEVRRQRRTFQIVIWADTPAHRDAIAAPIDAALAATFFLTLPDGFAARLIYHSSPMNDGLQKTGLYRRDLFYSVEYATTTTETDTQITQPETLVAASIAGVDPAATVADIFY